MGLKGGQRANTTEWGTLINGLAPGLHIVAVQHDGVHSFTKAELDHTLKLQGGGNAKEVLDQWIHNTPYPGVWRVYDDAQLEFLNMAPNKFHFAMFLLGTHNDDEKEHLEIFRNLSKSSSYSKRGTFGIYYVSDWDRQSSKYGVNFAEFHASHHHLVFMTENGTYWYEDPEHINLDAMLEGHVESLLRDHYPQHTSPFSYLWWYGRRVWRYGISWLTYATEGPIEALYCMGIIASAFSCCVLCGNVVDAMERWVARLETAKTE